jgi:hypothetical protein
MDDAPLRAQITNVERQGHAVLFLSACNMIMNVMTLVLWALLSLA